MLRLRTSNSPRASSPAESELFRLAHAGDTEAREQLVNRFLGLAFQVARRYRRGSDSDDVKQVASLGLLKAIDRFDPERGFAFSTFAVPTIAGELKRHFRDTGWSVRVSRSLQERTLHVETAIEHLEPGLGRAPTTCELADHLLISEAEVLEALGAATSRQARPLELTSDDDENERVRPELAAIDKRYDRVDDLATVSAPFATLPTRDQRILRMRFTDDLTQREIAGKIGISQMHVSRLIRRSIDQLGAAVASQ